MRSLGVTVVLTDSGEIRLEGPLCHDYFKIRDIVYAQYHIC